MIGSISGTGSYFVMYGFHFSGGVSESAKQADVVQGPGAALQLGRTSFGCRWLGGGAALFRRLPSERRRQQVLRSGAMSRSM